LHALVIFSNLSCSLITWQLLLLAVATKALEQGSALALVLSFDGAVSPLRESDETLRVLVFFLSLLGSKDRSSVAVSSPLLVFKASFFRFRLLFVDAFLSLFLRSLPRCLFSFSADSVLLWLEIDDAADDTDLVLVPMWVTISILSGEDIVSDNVSMQ
jgi:hypothetical protein